MNEISIKVEGLTKVFGAGDVLVRAVHDVDLEVRRGEVVLIMGPSGSGKTTLLSMLGGMLRPTSGRIAVDGVDLATLSESRLPAFRASRFGFVFQDFNLLSALTAQENGQAQPRERTPAPGGLRAGASPALQAAQAVRRREAAGGDREGHRESASSDSCR